MSKAVVTGYSFQLDVEGENETIDVVRMGETRQDGTFDLGADVWAIKRSGGLCLSRERKWDHHPLPSNRDDAWKQEHRWPLTEALLVAEEEADRLADKINAYLDRLKDEQA